MDKKMIIIIVVNTIVLLALMGGGFLFMVNKMGATTVAQDQGKENGAAENLNQKETKKILPLDTFIVNLSGEDGRRYLRATMELELVGQETVNEVEMCMPQIRDAVLMILPARGVEEILTIDGKNDVRETIVNKVNSLITVGTVSNLYFTEFVIQ